MLKKLSHEDYTVGWICPLEVEQIAALEMLDEEQSVCLSRQWITTCIAWETLLGITSSLRDYINQAIARRLQSSPR